MVFGKVKDTMADLAETLRRAFQDLRTHCVDLSIPAPLGLQVSALEARSAPPVVWPATVSCRVALIKDPTLVEASLGFGAKLRGESAWARWAAGATVFEMPVFRAEACPRLEVPPLPRAGKIRSLAPQSFQTRAHQRREPILPARTRSEAVRLAPPMTRKNLDLMLSLPVAVCGEDIQKISKALWMRYTLQLVKATNQNIRNLDILGLYWIPEQGVAGLRHDGKSGRLLLTLSSAASGARRKPFLLARCKEDRSLVSCFLEDIG
jgi:hypothetical protein